MLDELILGGEIQETSKNTVLKAIAQQDLVQEVRDKNLIAINSLILHTFLNSLLIKWGKPFSEASLWGRLLGSSEVCVCTKGEICIFERGVFLFSSFLPIQSSWSVTSWHFVP